MSRMFVTAAKAYIARMRQDEPQGTYNLHLHRTIALGVTLALQPAAPVRIPCKGISCSAGDTCSKVLAVVTGVDADEDHAALSERLQQQALEVCCSVWPASHLVYTLCHIGAHPVITLIGCQSSCLLLSLQAMGRVQRKIASRVQLPDSRIAASAGASTSGRFTKCHR